MTSKRLNSQDTIAAIATSHGRGGIGVIRISGPKVGSLIQILLGKTIPPRYATYAKFLGEKNIILDEGIALYFPAPHSFTGEDILELQGHGGPVLLDQLLKYILTQGVRQARPGEFSERAFINDKIDLIQAEAIADLINAHSTLAAQSAMRSLQGEFSLQIHILLTALVHLRMMVEAAIDFPEEEIDFLTENRVVENLQILINQVANIETTTKQGVLLQEGLSLVICGPPNAGKSSLLNILSGQNSAIVTPIPGTTRDLLKEFIQIDGLPLHIIDTAGLRDTTDLIEQEGIRRTEAALEQADVIIFMLEATQLPQNSSPENLVNSIISLMPRNIQRLKEKLPLLMIKNKIDLTAELPKKMILSQSNTDHFSLIQISTKTGAGIDLLKNSITELGGFNVAETGTFIARRRHLTALSQTKRALISGLKQLNMHRAGELLAEDLRSAQNYLNEITGEFNSEDLLGEIFSHFCIGK